MSSQSKWMDGNTRRRRKRDSDNNRSESAADRPFFSDNLGYYTKLPQPTGPKRDSLRYHKDWNSYSETVQVEQEKAAQFSKKLQNRRRQPIGAAVQRHSIDGNVKNRAYKVVSFKDCKGGRGYNDTVQVKPGRKRQLGKRLSEPESIGADLRRQSTNGHVKNRAYKTVSFKDYKDSETVQAEPEKATQFNEELTQSELQPQPCGSTSQYWQSYSETVQVEPKKTKYLSEELLAEPIGADPQSPNFDCSAKNLGTYSELFQPCESTSQNYRDWSSYNNTFQEEPENTNHLSQELLPESIGADPQRQTISGSAKNIGYYSELLQPCGSTVDESQYYRDWKSYNDTVQVEANEEMPAEPIRADPQRRIISSNAEACQLLGERVYAWTHQPNGRPLVSLPALAAMSGVHLASVLMAAHLIQNRQDPSESCMMTHFNANQLRSYFVMCDEVRAVLNRCERRELNLYNAVPVLGSPMAHDLPLPPSQWLSQPNLKPKQQKRLPQNRLGVDARGQDRFVNPNLRLIAEWQPETSSYNYRLQSP
ncbi:hypothetical protein AWZ03_013608 [Drosophila navojoa]|uniref:Uncharacterized protein n=1 Tax=Drosophila navojoa TaxID=7232 RepID=A0A484ATN2_DRONA|nr:hypothetical protein AWZ03_013608 [Drosophila navojoa]